MARAAASFLRHPSYPAKINPSHPIGRKVTACISPHYGAPSARPMEMVSGLPATIGAGVINGLSAGAIGKAFRASTTSSGVYWSPPTLTPYGDGSLPFSVEILFTFLAADAQFSRLLDCGGAGAAGGVTGGWDIETDASGTGLIFASWSGAVPATTTAVSSMVAGRTYHIVITLVPGGNTARIYLNGVDTGNPVANNITAANTARFYLDTYRTAGDLSCAGIALHYARVYQGSILTPNEIWQLYARPFEMFRKLRRGAMKAPAAGGSFIPGWATGATRTIGGIF